MAFDFRDLAKPILVAPMAGGPSTPELAAAGTNAGGLGFVAAGYLTAEVFAERITAARGLASGPIGANLFAPQPSAGTRADIERYAKALAPEAERYGAQLGEPRFDDDHWAAKIDVLLDVRPDVASFTFGVPSAEECGRLREAGITVVDVPVVAAGGLMTADDVGRVMAAGAAAAQLGTAFLLSAEAGSSPVHRAALQNPRFTETVVTRAFSGRYARGLRNRFIDEHEAEAPLGYPEVHWLTSPLRAASVRAGDPQAVNIWAGTGFRRAKTGTAAEIIGGLT